MTEKKEILRRDSNTITIANFWENHLLGKYDYEPAYQRKSIWSDEKQSYLIDSILKNFPMPPIFLRQKIDNETGKTSYDVIDGKQRLTSIVKFIENKIPSAAEYGDMPFEDEAIAGAYFKDLDDEELREYKKAFWRYIIPIEYVDTSDSKVIDNIFDRLNRNGEALAGQELRNASYHGTPLLNLSEELSSGPFWSKRLETTDKNRMEDIEFVSELLFVILEGKPLHANSKTLDSLYKKYKTKSVNWDSVKQEFLSYTKYLEDLSLDYDEHKISGVSHLYGLWCFAKYAFENGISLQSIKPNIVDFYEQLRENPDSNEHLAEYKKSMSSRTKDQSQRRKRVEALKSYLEI